MFKDKGMIIGIVATVVIIIGGILLMGGKGNTSSVSSEVDSQVLVREESHKTSGIVSGDYIEASVSAKVTIVEFGDYECPACINYHSLIKRLLSEFSGRVNFVFRNYPLSYHANSLSASYAVEAAGLQGKFWQMHDMVYENESSWADAKDTNSIFSGYAQKLGLDVDKFNSDASSDTVKNRVEADKNDGNLVKLNATPTFYINGVKFENLTGNYEDLKNAVETELGK